MIEFIENSVFFGAFVSLGAYEIGLLMKRKFKLAIFNPLLISIFCVMGILMVLGVDYESYEEGGKYISYLLTPATVCLAVPLYQQLHLLKKNIKAIAAGIVSGVLASLVSVLLLAKLFGLSHEEYVTLLPKSITTAIGMGVSEELGGIVTITVAVIIITGVLGNVIADAVYKIAKIEEPVAKGLALGTSAHAIGTAKAMELGEVEGAMSSLAIAVAGLLTVIAASVFAGLDVKNAVKIYKRDRRNHASPNSAQTEAAMAGALRVQLAGNAYYFGKLYEKPTIGDDLRSVEAEDIKRANRLLYATAWSGAILFSLVWIFVYWLIL